MVTLSSKLYSNVLPASVGGTGVTTASAAVTALGAQTLLVSGTSIKTVNSTSLLGSGNIAIKCIMPTSVVTGSYTATAFELIRCNSLSSAFTITFPLSPADGDIITVLDIAGLFNTNAVTLSSNGKYIENDTSLVLNIPYACVTFVYEVSTTNWALIDNKSNIMPIVVPTPPINVSATISLKTATVLYAAPVSDGGGTITGYTATSSPGGLTGTANYPATSITISNLLPSTTYTFTVTATNVAGISPSSSVTGALTTLPAPTAPTGVSAVGGNTQAVVSFTASTADPAVPITGYTVTSSAGQTASGASSPITVTGLTNGSSYTFTVSATNTMGTTTSTPSSQITLPIYDPNFSSVTVLINADTGGEASNVFYDRSSNARTVTTNGNIKVTTGAYTSGTGSINNYSGTVGSNGSGYLTMAPTATNTIGLSNDFTVEFWFHPVGAQASWVGFCGNYLDAGYGARSSWAIGYDGGGTGISCSCAFGTSAGSYVGTAVYQVSNWTWHHLAFVRNGSSFIMYIDGTNRGSFTDARAIYDGGSYLEIGSYIQGGYKFNGYMDDFRITQVARYTANFAGNLPPKHPTQ
jgi:hypothetical protein